MKSSNNIFYLHIQGHICMYVECNFNIHSAFGSVFDLYWLQREISASLAAKCSGFSVFNTKISFMLCPQTRLGQQWEWTRAVMLQPDNPKLKLIMKHRVKQQMQMTIFCRSITSFTLSWHPEIFFQVFLPAGAASLPVPPTPAQLHRSVSHLDEWAKLFSPGCLFASRPV